MAHLDRCLEATPDRGAGHRVQGARRGIAGFIEVQVHRQAAFLGKHEEPVKQGLEFGRRRLTALPCRGHTQDAAGRGDLIRQCHAIVAGEAFQRADGNRLQVDPAGPGIAQSPEHRPMRPGIRPIAIQMRADRGGAVRQGAAQPELKPRLDIGFVIILATIGDDRGLGARMGAVRVGLTRPCLGLVQVDMSIDETGPDLAAIQVDPVRGGFRRRDGGDAAAGDP